MDVRNRIVAVLKSMLDRARNRPVLAGLVGLLVGLLAVFGAVMASGDPEWAYGLFGAEEKFRVLEFLGVAMGGVLLAIGAVIAHKRAVALERAAEAQAGAATAQAAANKGAEDGRRQERLKNAIEHLGHESDSVRLGGAYELFHLARDTEEARDTKDLCQTVMDILCAHIRRTTSDKNYQDNYKSKPSEEIESLLNLLFRQEHEVFKGCHIDLRESWLNRAMLRSARLQGALLTGAWLQGAFLCQARLQGADLYKAHLQRAELSKTHLQGANLYGAHLQGAKLSKTHLQGADLYGAHLQGAYLRGAQLQGATSVNAKKMSFVKRICKGIDQQTGQSLVSKLPDDHGAILGAYTAEEAERWIAEYAEATGESPEAGG